jgi:uncharacterized membrane protein YgcG
LIGSVNSDKVVAGSTTMAPSLRLILRVPLFRLLAVNLAIGTAVAVLLLGGLIAFNLYGLRDLIVADYSPATALGLLLFGLFITFGSTAMGTAIMALEGLTESSATGGQGGGGSSGGGCRGDGRRRVAVPASDKRAAVRVRAR